MSGFLDVQAVLDSHLATLPDSPPVAWENVPYTPQEGVTYLRPSNLPAGTAAIGFASDDSTRAIGIYQVDALTPVGGGPGEAMNLADRIADLFRQVRGQRLISGDSTVIVGVPTQDPSIAGGAWFMVSTLIPYDSLFRS